MAVRLTMVLPMMQQWGRVICSPMSMLNRPMDVHDSHHQARGEALAIGRCPVRGKSTKDRLPPLSRTQICVVR